MDVDAAFRRLGKPGRFQVCVYLMLCVHYFPVVTNHLAMAVYGASIPHHCRIPDHLTPNESIPTRETQFTNAETVLDSCSVYVNFSSVNNATEQCPDGWEYDSWPRQRNIIMQFDLVCDRAYLANIANTVYFIGVMVSGPIFGTISDHYGRKPVILSTLYAYIAASILLVLVSNFIVFVIVRFVIGALLQGLHSCSFVLLMEFFVPEYRTLAGLSADAFWGLAVVWLAVVSWLLQDWRYIQLAIALPSLVAISYIWLLPESVRWLMTRGKTVKAEAVVRKAAHFNGVVLEDDVFATKSLLQIDDLVVTRESDDHENKLAKVNSVSDVRTYTLFSMFSHGELLKRSLILFYIWFAIAVGYFGLSFGITKIGNTYLNLLLCGVLELPVYLAAIPIVNKFGRKLPLCIYLLVGGAMCIAASLTKEEISGVQWLQWVGTSLVLFGRLAIAGCFNILLLYTCELYPTVIRNASVGMCSFWMKMGAAVAPLVLLLGDAWLSCVPLIVNGLLALIGCLLASLLPETQNRPLADTIEDVAGIRHDRRHTKETIEAVPLQKVPSEIT